MSSPLVDLSRTLRIGVVVELVVIGRHLLDPTLPTQHPLWEGTPTAVDPSARKLFLTFTAILAGSRYALLQNPKEKGLKRAVLALHLLEILYFYLEAYAKKTLDLKQKILMGIVWAIPLQIYADKSENEPSTI